LNAGLGQEKDDANRCLSRRDTARAANLPEPVHDGRCAFERNIGFHQAGVSGKCPDSGCGAQTLVERLGEKYVSQLGIAVGLQSVIAAAELRIGPIDAGTIMRGGAYGNHPGAGSGLKQGQQLASQQKWSQMIDRPLQFHTIGR